MIVTKQWKFDLFNETPIQFPCGEKKMLRLKHKLQDGKPLKKICESQNLSKKHWSHQQTRITINRRIDFKRRWILENHVNLGRNLGKSTRSLKFERNDLCKCHCCLASFWHLSSYSHKKKVTRDCNMPHQRCSQRHMPRPWHRFYLSNV